MRLPRTIPGVLDREATTGRLARTFGFGSGDGRRTARLAHVDHMPHDHRLRYRDRAAMGYLPDTVQHREEGQLGVHVVGRAE